MNEPKTLSPPRRTVRPTGGPAGFVPRRLMRTAKFGLLAGAGVAGLLAVLPAPRGSERFEVAFADWRADGAWYAGDAPPDTTVPLGPLGPGAAGPALLAEAGEPSAPRLATLPAGATGRLRDSPAAPLRPGRPVGPREPEEAPPAPAPSAGPAVPPPAFADTPIPDPPTDGVETDADGGLRDEVRALREEIRRLREALAAPPAAPTEPGEDPR